MDLDVDARGTDGTSQSFGESFLDPSGEFRLSPDRGEPGLSLSPGREEAPEPMEIDQDKDAEKEENGTGSSQRGVDKPTNSDNLDENTGFFDPAGIFDPAGAITVVGNYTSKQRAGPTMPHKEGDSKVFQEITSGPGAGRGSVLSFCGDWELNLQCPLGWALDDKDGVAFSLQEFSVRMKEWVDLGGAMFVGQKKSVECNHLEMKIKAAGSGLKMPFPKTSLRDNGSTVLLRFRAEYVKVDKEKVISREEVVSKPFLALHNSETRSPSKKKKELLTWTKHSLVSRSLVRV